MRETCRNHSALISWHNPFIVPTYAPPSKKKIVARQIAVRFPLWPPLSAGCGTVSTSNISAATNTPLGGWSPMIVIFVFCFPKRLVSTNYGWSLDLQVPVGFNSSRRCLGHILEWYRVKTTSSCRITTETKNHRLTRKDQCEGTVHRFALWFKSPSKSFVRPKTYSAAYMSCCVACA